MPSALAGAAGLRRDRDRLARPSGRRPVARKPLSAQSDLVKINDMGMTAAQRPPTAGTEPRVGIRMLGGLSVLRDGAEASLPPSRKTRALLAYLAAMERPVRRERLCELFWEVPDDPKGALRWSLSRLRQVLGDAIEADRETVSLRRDRVDVDYGLLRGTGGEDIHDLPLDDLETRVAAFRGNFLEDLSLPRCPEYEAWRKALANEVEVSRLRLLRELVDRLRDEPEKALPHANALRALSPEDDALAAEVAALTEASRRRAVLQPAGADAGSPPPTPVVPPQEIRYVAGFGGAQIAYAVTGNGYPLLKCGNWMSDLQYDRQSSVWAHWIAGLSARNMLVRYDQRGNGLSDRDVDDVSFDAQLTDLEAVADAAGLERFVLVGISAGSALSVAYAVRHPERVSHLILYGGRDKGWRLSGTAEDQAHRAAMVALIRSGWGRDIPAFRQLFTSLFIPDAAPAQMDWYNELQRRTVSPEMAARLHEESGKIDISDILARVTAPTLVMHSSGDALVPFERGRALAIGIPGARFVSLDSRNHILLSTEPAFRRFLEELWRFVGETAEPAP